MDYYDVAQICVNGHIVTWNANSCPEFRKKHCPKCGEPTIIACTACCTPIQGEFHVEGVIAIGGGDSPPPSFCHECGKPYPWTAKRIEAARELADEFDELSVEDRDKLKKSLDDIFTDNPRTEISASRFKRIMAKVGKSSYETMKTVVVDVLSDAAKKVIFGG